MAIALGPRLSLTAELEVLMQWPADVMSVTDVVTFDHPTLLGHAGLLANF